MRFVLQCRSKFDHKTVAFLLIGFIIFANVDAGASAIARVQTDC